jgi:hypothetical protein
MSEDTNQQLQVEEIIAEPMGNSDGQAIKAVVPDIGYIPLQDFLGMSHPDDEQKEKMAFIWSEVGKGRSREETLEAIKEIRHRLSPPEIGESYLHKLWAYVRLLADGRSIEREKKTYESNG